LPIANCRLLRVSNSQFTEITNRQCQSAIGNRQSAIGNYPPVILLR
jgi:hypothetical protein